MPVGQARNAANMPVEIHRLRLPTTVQTGSTADTVVIKKATRRFVKDLRLYLRSSPVAVFAFVLVAVLVFRALYARASPLSGNVSALLTEYPDATCACPPPVSSDTFVKRVLDGAEFVARVTVDRAEILAQERGMRVRILQLFRGHVRAVQWPVWISERIVSVCRGSATHRDQRVQKHGDWLVVGGGLHSSNATVFCSTLAPGGACDSGEHGERGVAWMAPWQTLSSDVKEVLRTDSGEGELWWRQRGAWHSFVDAAERAANSSLQGGAVLLDSHRLEESVIRSGQTQRSFAGGSGEWWLSDGVSVIAACKDRTQTLRSALLSWASANGVDEIVIVDWSSSVSLRGQLTPELAADPRLVVVSVDGQTEWILSRAYNLAANVASKSKLLKVDCDTLLEPDFIDAHPLPRERFYAGDWGVLETPATEMLHLAGLLYLYRDDFLAIGGYDERVTTYGWDDSDIGGRLARIRSVQRFQYDKVHHIAHSSALRIAHQNRHSLLSADNPHAAAVEIQRNRILLTRFNLAPWRVSSMRTLWNAALDSSIPASAVVERFARNVLIRRSTRAPLAADAKESRSLTSSNASSPSYVHLIVTAANEIPSVSELVSDSDAVDVGKRAIRLVLGRYGVPTLPKTLTLTFFKSLITKVAFPGRFAEVAFSLRGGCASRLLAHVATYTATGGSAVTANFGNASPVQIPPKPYIGWRPISLWQSPVMECGCRFSNSFEAVDSEIVSSWLDIYNPSSLFRRRSARNVSWTDVRSALDSYATDAITKNSSRRVLEWQKSTALSQGSKDVSPKEQRILMAELACDVIPELASGAHRDGIRAALRNLVPTQSTQDAVLASLNRLEPTILDNLELSEEFWPKLVGESHAALVQEQFSSPRVHAMSATWGVLGAAAGHVEYHLDRRAAALSVAMHYSAIQDYQNRTAVLGIDSLLRRVNRMFAGCPAPPSAYLDVYPELSMVLAGLLSSQSCML